MNETQTIEQLEQANDNAVRARETALDARRRRFLRGVTDAEAVALQAEVDRTAREADAARARLTAAYRTENR
jgi:hypothetical protein